MSIPILRNSERSTFKRCPQRWWWAWREGLRPLRDANPLWFGQGIHLALAEWYLEGDKRGPHPVETWEKFVADEERFIPVDYEEDEYKLIEAKELGKTMLNGYIEEYGRDDDWDVIATERTFKMPIKTQNGKSRLVDFVGTMDGVYRQRSTGEVWLMEHKTAKAIFLNHLPLDDQAGAYFMVATQALRSQGLIKKDEELQGIMYNFLRKGLPDTRPKNAEGLRTNKPTRAHYVDALVASGEGRAALARLTIADMENISAEKGLRVTGEVSKMQPTPLFHREPVWRSAGERRTTYYAIQAEAIHMKAMKTHKLPLYKNPTRDCSWDCSFYRMCVLHEAGEDWKEYAESEFKKEDPYKDHRNNRKSASS